MEEVSFEDFQCGCAWNFIVQMSLSYTKNLPSKLYGT